MVRQMGSHDTKDVKDLSRLIQMAVILSSVSRMLIALNHLAEIQLYNSLVDYVLVVGWGDNAYKFLLINDVTCL